MNFINKIKAFISRNARLISRNALLVSAICLAAVLAVEGGLIIAKSTSADVAVKASVNDWGLGFGKTANMRPKGNISAEELAASNAVFIGEDTKTIYLTFDAGYENGYTEKILDTLKEKHVPAAFFLVSHYFNTNPKIVKRMSDEGHVIANHTSTHPDMSKLTSVEALKNELEPVEKLCLEYTGREIDKFYRPPRGQFSRTNLVQAESLGYTTIFWSLAYADWDVTHQPSPEAAKEKLNSRIHNGAVVLLHSTSATNAEILGDLIDTWRGMGYEFGTLYDLTKQNAPK